MKFVIKHRMCGRIRVHLSVKRLTYNQADTIEYYLSCKPDVTRVKVYERTGDVAVCFSCAEDEIIDMIKKFDFDRVSVPQSVFESSGRESDALYFEKIVGIVFFRYIRKLFIPASIRIAHTLINSVRYIYRGLSTLKNKRLEVPLLDAIAIGASVITKDYNTADSVMFLLEIGDILEDRTHKKSIDDLAKRMSLNVSKVWVIRDKKEYLIDAKDVTVGDNVVVRMGNIIPFDGKVCDGDAMVNQASMTGESVPVHKDMGKSVYAGTVIEEGEITICVTRVSGKGRFDTIVRMIEDSERFKSGVESKAWHLADKLVPYSLAGTLLTYLITRNITKTISVLMVDYSCALKLAMPLSVLSAMREAGEYDITVKGGKFLEAVSESDVMVFDKTGTLTKASPTVVDVISFNGESDDELLREAACLEEHFPHSVASAVVKAAKDKGLNHDEMHTKVEYIVAHGIVSQIDGKKTLIGSYHFLFEDEGVEISDEDRDRIDAMPEEYSRLYYAKEGRLAAVILIADPMRDEAPYVISKLRELGIKKTVMMTGDSKKTAKAIANRIGIDEYYAEILPEDKAGYIRQCHRDGKKVIMIGDGINDSPALSEADAGIAINEGAEIARQIADITIGSDDLKNLLILKQISDALMKRIRSNYRGIVGINTAIILFGVFGVLSPSVSATLHNSYTIALGLKSTTALLDAHSNDDL